MVSSLPYFCSKSKYFLKSVRIFFMGILCETARSSVCLSKMKKWKKKSIVLQIINGSFGYNIVISAHLAISISLALIKMSTYCDQQSTRFGYDTRICSNNACAWFFSLNLLQSNANRLMMLISV